MRGVLSRFRRHAGKAVPVAVLLLAQAGGSIAAPVVAVTEGTGPDERVLRYELQVDPQDIADYDPVVRRTAERMASGIIAERRQALLDAGLQAFGDLYGGAQSLGTLGEHALMHSGLGKINKLFNYGGAVFAAVTAARQFSAGDPDEGMATSTKAIINFAISEFGWGSLQVAGVSLYIFDIVLREWQDAVMEAGVENFQGVYDAEMRKRARSINDWKRVVWEIYLQAERDAGGREPDGNRFRELLDAEIRRHVTVALTPEVLLEWEKSHAGLGMTGFHGIIERQLADTRGGALQAMLTLRVLPEVMRRAADRSLDRLLAVYNTELKREMNRKLRLQVTVFGPTGPVGVAIPLPAGGEWTGETGPDGTFTLEITNFARIRAGLPDRVRVDMPGGVEEKPFLRRGQEAVAVFGRPRTPYVARYRFEESPVSCRRTTRDALTDAFVGSETFGRDTPGTLQLDMSGFANGTVIVGRYDSAARDWPVMSPGLWQGNELHLGEPRVLSISRLRNCRFDFFTPGIEFQSGACEVLRENERIVGDNRVRTTCDSTARLELAAIVAEMGDETRVLDVAGAEGQALVRVIRQSLRRGLENFDPSMLRGGAR